MDYYHYTINALQNKSKITLKALENSDQVYKEIAMQMLRIIQDHNRNNQKTVLIVPVGPIGQYPYFIQMVNEQNISLANCWFFNMDEYLTDDRQWIGHENMLSFRGFMQREVYDQISPNLTVPLSQRIFPNPNQPQAYDELLMSLGGADACFGGIGINGHLAFNEPQPTMSIEEFSSLPTRVSQISPETRTANAIGSLGGAIELMPQYCVTVGMRSILSSKKLIFAVFRDWHRAVVRRASCADVNAAFPASMLQTHPDSMIYLNSTASALPFRNA